MEFHDRTLNCIDCGADFVFTAGEQLFFHDKQFKNEPKRCKTCKTKRLASVGAIPVRQGFPRVQKLKPLQCVRIAVRKRLCLSDPLRAVQYSAESVSGNAARRQAPELLKKNSVASVAGRS